MEPGNAELAASVRTLWEESGRYASMAWRLLAPASLRRDSGLPGLPPGLLPVRLRVRFLFPQLSAERQRAVLLLYWQRTLMRALARPHPWLCTPLRQRLAKQASGLVGRNHLKIVRDVRRLIGYEALPQLQQRLLDDYFADPTRGDAEDAPDRTPPPGGDEDDSEAGADPTPQAEAYARRMPRLLEGRDLAPDSDAVETRLRHAHFKVGYLFPLLSDAQRDVIETLYWLRVLVERCVGMNRPGLQPAFSRPMEQVTTLSEQTYLAMADRLREEVSTSELSVLQRRILRRDFLTLPLDEVVGA